jgi:hypothetical protein
MRVKDSSADKVLTKATKRVSIADHEQTMQEGEDHRGDGDEQKKKDAEGQAEQERKEAEAERKGKEEAEQERKEAEDERKRKEGQDEQERKDAEAKAKKVVGQLAADSKEGKDFIGTLKWAGSLTRLLFCGKGDINLVIGLYAQWGVGKSFMMEKIILSIQCAWLEQRYKNWNGTKKTVVSIQHGFVPDGVDDGLKEETVDNTPLGVLLRRRIVALLEDSKDNYIECWWRSAVLADCNQGGNALMQRLGCGGHCMKQFGCSTDSVEPSLIEAEFIKQQLQETPSSTLEPEVKKAVDKKWNSMRKPHFHFLKEVHRALLEIFLVAPVYRWLSCLTRRLFVCDPTAVAVEAILLRHLLRHPNGKLFTAKCVVKRQCFALDQANWKGDGDPAVEDAASTKGWWYPGSPEKKEKREKRDIVFVWFNAWLYDDTDNMVSVVLSVVTHFCFDCVSQQPLTLSLSLSLSLSCALSLLFVWQTLQWVGLVQKLHEAAEEHFGSDYAFAKRRAELYRTVLLVLIVLSLLVYIVTWVVEELEEHESMDEDSYLNLKNAGSLLFKNTKAVITAFGTILAVGASFSSASAFSQQKNRRSAQLGHDASAKDFRKLGYAQHIQEEIKQLAGLLNDPETMKTMYDYLLPDWMPLRQWLLHCLKGSRTRPRQKCSFVIFVDDLDRCIPAKAVEVGV